MNEHTRRGRTPHDELDEIAGNIEDEIGQAVHGNRPPIKSLDDISRASSEATMMQYEAIAKNIEMLGAATHGRISKLMENLDQQIEETAAVVRQRGEVAQKIVEDIGALTKGVRDLLIDAQRKVGG